jgi:hypothetical protein
VNDADYGIELPFGLGRDFERGLEFGLLYARVKDYGHTESAMHADLAELVMRLADGAGKPFRAQPHEHDDRCQAHHRDDEDWLDVTIG